MSKTNNIENKNSVKKTHTPTSKLIVIVGLLGPFIWVAELSSELEKNAFSQRLGLARSIKKVLPKI